MGTVILAGIFITNQQIVSYQEQDVEESKQVAIDSFQRLADRKERRLETIAAGLVGLYRGSTPIEPVEFQSFVSEITRITPDLDFVVVTQGGRIVQTYPDTSFVVGEETNKVLGKSYLRNLQDETQVLFEFPIDGFAGDDRTIVLAVGPEFFVDPNEILADGYKATIAVFSSESAAATITPVYYASKFGGIQQKGYDNFAAFSESEASNSIHVTITTGLRAYETHSVMILSYDVWHSSFEIRSIPLQYLSVVIGSAVAVAVSILLLRSQILSEKLRKNLDKLKLTNSSLIS